MQADKSERIVANWILLGIVMLIIQVLLGGLTRLTGSGLSITEWKPIMGAMPPMNTAEWEAAFAKYQQIAQYKYLNTHFTLGEFKFIFFWEWFHRLWARLIGVVFLIPFIYFLVKKYIKSWMVIPLIILFLLGAMQGAIGWIMVQSGLNENDLYVSHIRLAAHFIAAMILIAYALVFWLRMKVNIQNIIVQPGLKRGAAIIMLLLVIQLIYGAFMAGLKAAPVAPTWPTINGMWYHSSMFSGGLKSIFHNAISIHFIHRNLAYLLVVLIIIWWWKAKNISYSREFNIAKNLVVLFVLIQVTFGVLTVITSPKMVAGKFGVFEWMAQLHQLVGMLLFLSLVAVLYLTKAKIYKSPDEHPIFHAEIP
jgi:cytochrome c oxidase assembly protein subunit 15